MYLGGYSSNQGSAGVANEVNGYQGLEAAVHAIDPQAIVDFLPGVPEPGNLRPIDPASVAAAAASYDAVVVYAGTDATHRQRGPATAPPSRCPGAQADLIREVAAEPTRTHDRLPGDGRPVDVSGFEPATSPAMLWSSYNGQ